MYIHGRNLNFGQYCRKIRFEDKLGFLVFSNTQKVLSLKRIKMICTDPAPISKKRLPSERLEARAIKRNGARPGLATQIVFDIVNDIIGIGPRAKDLSYTYFLETRYILLRDNATSNNQNIIYPPFL